MLLASRKGYERDEGHDGEQQSEEGDAAVVLHRSMQPEMGQRKAPA